MRRLILLLFLSAAAAFAQLDDNTITVTASREVTLQPDQAAFVVMVATPASAGLEDALAKVSDIGITASELTGVFSDIADIAGMISWDFTLTTPLSQAGATATLLAQLQQKSAGTVSFEFQGTHLSPAAQQSQPCSQTALMADAQKRAQALASAAGLTVGPVLAVSDGSGISATPAAVVAVSGFGFVGALTSVTVGQFEEQLTVTSAPGPTTCTAVVKFQLYSYH